MTLPRIVGLVPMRHHSERVPGKNYRPFAGRPLYHYVIEALLAVPRIEAVVIDTDSLTIKEDAAVHFPTVTVLDRPAHLRAGNIPMNDVLRHVVESVPADYYLQTHSTNPLLQVPTISDAIDQFLNSFPKHDSLFSVTRWQTRLWDAQGRPLNHDPAVLLRTQDLPPIYEENSCIFLFSGEVLRQRGNRIGDRPLLFEIPAEEAWDIDVESDFQMAEMLYLAKQEVK